MNATTLEKPADKTTWLETPGNKPDTILFTCAGPFGSQRKLELSRNPGTPFERKVLECARAGYGNPQEAARGLDPDAFNAHMALQTGKRTPQDW